MVLITGTWGGIRQIDGRTLLFLILSGLATGAIVVMLFFMPFKKGISTRLFPLINQVPCCLFFWHSFSFHEGISGKKIIFVLLIGIGTMMMITKKDIKNRF